MLVTGILSKFMHGSLKVRLVGPRPHCSELRDIGRESIFVHVVAWIGVVTSVQLIPSYVKSTIPHSDSFIHRLAERVVVVNQLRERFRFEEDVRRAGVSCT